MSRTPPFDPWEFFRRIFEPLSPGPHFQIGDRVKLKRPDLLGLVPVGAEGVVKAIAAPDDIMYEKGRPYEVEFDLTPFQLPYPPEIVTWAPANQIDLPPYRTATTTWLSANDLEQVDHQ